MPSSYTQNINLEKPATGEQAGTWGDTANSNFDIIDKAIDGSITISMPAQTTPNAPYPLSTTEGGGAADMPPGLNKVLTFTGGIGADGYVQINPNTASRLYFVTNQTIDSAGAGNKYNLIFQQVNSGGATFALQQGYSAVIYADGGMAAGNVRAVLDSPQVNNLLVTGNLQVNGQLTQGSSGAGAKIVIDQANGLGIGTSHSPPKHAIDIGDGLGGEIWIDTADSTTHWRQIVWSSNGLARWALRTTVSPGETGSNVGSDLFFANFDDGGNSLASILYMNRASGNVTIGQGADQNSRLAVLGSNPSMTVLGVRAAAGQTALAPVVVVQNSAGANLMAVDNAGMVRALSLYAPIYTTGASPGQFTGISGQFTLGGVTLYFQSGLLVQHA